MRKINLIYKNKQYLGMAQVVESLPSKLEVLSSISSIKGKRKKKF